MCRRRRCWRLAKFKGDYSHPFCGVALFALREEFFLGALTSYLWTNAAAAESRDIVARKYSFFVTCRKLI
jgi:hypothetical protein